MILFLNDATKNKKLDSFPNGWTGKELIELANDLKEYGIMFKVEKYDGYPTHILFCSEKFNDYDQVGLQHQCITPNEYTFFV